MRPSASLCQSSRYRLLTLLITLLLGILGAHTVGGSLSSSPNLGLTRYLNKSKLMGGTPLERSYHLISQCARHVQITPARGRKAVNARGANSSHFAELTFESHSPTELKILGVKSQRYLCFSRSGRLIARVIGRSPRCLFHEREKGGYIMLQSVAQPDWYVGFNKRGLSKRGFNRKRTRDLTPSHAGSSRSNPRRRGQRHRQHPNRRSRRRRLRHPSRKRGHRFRPRPLEVRDSPCFQFTKRRTQWDSTDPRVQNSKTKQIYDPWRNSDVSKFLSTRAPR